MEFKFRDLQRKSSNPLPVQYIFYTHDDTPSRKVAKGKRLEGSD